MTSHSKNKGSTTVSGLSFLSSVWVIPVTLATIKMTLFKFHVCYLFIHFHTYLFIYLFLGCLPAAGIFLDVRTRLMKVGWCTGTGEAMTLAAMSVIWSL